MFAPTERERELREREKLGEDEEKKKDQEVRRRGESKPREGGASAAHVARYYSDANDIF